MAKMTEAQEKSWGMGAHLIALAGLIIPLGNVLGPLILWLIKKDESPFVDNQGKESLNFQISMSIYCLVSAILIVIVVGIFLLIALGILDVVFVIIASIKANSGEKYRYPLTLRLVK